MNGGEEPATGGESSVGSPGDDSSRTSQLPEAVRARVIALAADALGRLPPEQVPPALKRVASFAPSRRARLAGSRIASALETDEDFRGQLATQVRAQVFEIAEALEAGSAPAAADPVELAAVAYLLRPEGWRDVTAKAAEAVDAHQTSAESQQLAAEVERLRRQVEDTSADLRRARDRSREQIGALKAENAELRRKLGEARALAQSARGREEAAQARAEAAADAAAAAAGSAEAEVRRLRQRVEDLERELGEARRVERAERGGGTLRARLLLDTMLDTAQGLRRELALPAVEGSPADAVEAHVAEQGSRAPTGHGSLSPDDPSLLDELLCLPRAHMIVDGYNVTKATWPEASLEVQRDRLLAGLGPLAARSGAEVTVVFDAADKAQRPLVNHPRHIRVLFSPFGVIADDVIRELVSAEPRGRPVVVVSNDQEVVRDVVRAGARAAASQALGRLLARS